MPPELRTLQRLFQELATASGLDERADRLLVGDARRPAGERLAVYADAYFWRIHDVLAEQHAALRRVVGARAFERLVRRYLDEHPPTGHDLALVGARLPAFLATDGETAQKPWLAELARLEWLHLDLFVAADARPLALADVQALPPGALPALRLAPVPAFALLECAYDVAALYADAAFVPPRRATRLVVWRQDIAVFHRVVDATEWPLLTQVARGVTLAELGEHLAADASVADAAACLGDLVTRWIRDQLLAA
jgi:hypothetical protein